LAAVAPRGLSETQACHFAVGEQGLDQFDDQFLITSMQNLRIGQWVNVLPQGRHISFICARCPRAKTAWPRAAHVPDQFDGHLPLLLA
jgi:hypothetical protein